MCYAPEPKRGSTVRRSTILLIAAGALLASPAAAGRDNQFDLVCTGKQTLKTGESATSWSERFRFDLDAKRWCRGKCTSAASLVSVTPDEITVYDSRASVGGPADTEMTLSRTSGKVSEYVRAGYSGRTFGLAEGSCKREYFSGFPGQKF